MKFVSSMFKSTDISLSGPRPDIAEKSSAPSVAPIGSWYLDLGTNLFSWSDHAFSLSPEAQPTNSLAVDEYAKLIHPEDREKWHKTIDRCTSQAQPYAFEFRELHPDGSIYWVETHGKGIVNQNNEIIAHHGIYQDVTNRKFQEGVRDGVSRLRKDFFKTKNPEALFESILDLVLKVTQSEYGFLGRILKKENGTPFLKTLAITDISWNEETRDFYDKNYESGLEFYNLQSLFGEVIKTGQVLFTNSPSKHPSSCGVPKGHPALNSFAGIPLFDGEQFLAMVGIANRPQGYNDQMIEDLAPLLEATADLLGVVKNMQREREAQTRLELMAFSSELGVWDWNLANNKVKYDERWCGMLGYSVDELDHTYETWARLIHDDDRDPSIAAFEDYLSGRTKAYEVKFRLKHKDGRWVPILSKGKVSERDRHGNPLKFSGTHYDLTYIQQMEKELEVQQKLAQHKAKLASIGELAAGVGHEINNPLAISLGYLERAERHIKNSAIKDPVIEKSFVKMRLAHKRIENIVNGLRTFARSENEEMIPIDLKQALEQTRLLLHEIYEKAGISLDFDLPEDELFVMGSIGKIQQALMNLITNAKDATEGQTRRDISVSLKKIHLDAVIYVKDNGKGIPSSISEKIFDAFFTTKDIGKGTGIGLSITGSIIRSLNGRIDFTSTPKLGTAFEVSLPITAERPTTGDHLGDKNSKGAAL